jgi:hypothetical protein
VVAGRGVEDGAASAWVWLWVTAGNDGGDGITGLAGQSSFLLFFDSVRFSSFFSSLLLSLLFFSSRFQFLLLPAESERELKGAGDREKLW